MASREENKKRQDYLMSMLAEVRQELGKIPGVFTVGVGLKEIKDQHTEEIVYRVYVREKKSTDQLQPHEMVPAQIRGVNTDVLVVPQAAPRVGEPFRRGDDLKYRPLHAGIMVGNEGPPGTLGCFARLNKNGTMVIVSNHHVLAKGKEVGDFIGQPNYYEYCCKCCGCHSNQVGIYIHGINTEKVDVAIANTLPDAVIEMENGIYNRLSEEKLTISGIAFATINDEVFKIGALSGYTRGIVKEIAGPVNSGDPDRVDQIYIVPAPGETFREGKGDKLAFSDSGDSGSIVLNKDHKIVGLLWGGFPFFKLKPTDPEPPTDISFATNIHDVLTALEQAGFGITIENTPKEDAIIAASTTKVVTSAGEKAFREKVIDSEQGDMWLELFNTHTAEINKLINTDRQVIVAWQRNQGPAFAAHFIKSTRDKEYKIPFEVENVSVQQLLIKMAAVLKARSSEHLKADLEKHAVDVIDLFSGIQSADELLERLNEKSFA